MRLVGYVTVTSMTFDKQSNDRRIEVELIKWWADKLGCGQWTFSSPLISVGDAGRARPSVRPSGTTFSSYFCQLKCHLHVESAAQSGCRWRPGHPCSCADPLQAPQSSRICPRGHLTACVVINPSVTAQTPRTVSISEATTCCNFTKWPVFPSPRIVMFTSLNAAYTLHIAFLLIYAA